MRELTREKTSKLVGGDWIDRALKQGALCDLGDARACRRFDRIVARHQL